MCMKGTKESCYLVERMAKVEAKQNMILGVMLVMFVVIAVMAFKLLNTQIYLLTGEGGLRSVTDASRTDVQTVHQISGGVVPQGKDNTKGTTK